MATLLALLLQLLHLALLLGGAPLVVGVVRWLKARLTGRRGASPLQPYRDLARLLRKQPVLAENASWVSEWAPVAALAAVAGAAALVPSFTRGMLLAPLGDLIVVFGLLGLGRMALALAGMDAGTAFGGLGAARQMGVAAFAKPALLLAALGIAMLAGGTGLEAIGAAFAQGTVGVRVSLALAAAALLAVAVAENARLPVDHPAARHELAMGRQAMLLESSGRHLALWEYAEALQLTLWLALLVALILPFGAAPAGAGPLAWGLGLAAFLAKMAALCLALAAFESAIAGMRVFRVPEFLGVAVLLTLAAAALLLVGTSFA